MLHTRVAFCDEEPHLDQPSDCTIEDKRSHYLLLRDDA